VGQSLFEREKKKKKPELSLVPFMQRRTEMAKWIAEAREAELEESDDDEEREDVTDGRHRAKMVWKWNQLHLPCFSGARSRHGQDSPQKRLMQSHG